MALHDPEKIAKLLQLQFNSELADLFWIGSQKVPTASRVLEAIQGVCSGSQTFETLPLELKPLVESTLVPLIQAGVDPRIIEQHLEGTQNELTRMHYDRLVGVVTNLFEVTREELNAYETHWDQVVYT